MIPAHSIPGFSIYTCMALLFFLLSTEVVISQSTERTEKHIAFDDMIANPAAVDSEQVAFIYLYYIEELVHLDPDTGIALYHEMAEFGKQLGNDDVISNGYASLSFMYKMRGDVQNQLKYALKSLTYTGDTILLAHTMGDLGIAYLEQAQFDSAHFYIDSALVLGTQLDSSWRSTFYVQKCQLLIRENKLHAALDILLKSIPFIPEENAIRRAEIFARVAQIYRLIGDLDKAIAYELKSDQISVAKNIRRNLAAGNARLGELYYRKGQDSLSRVHLEKAIPYAIERKYDSALLTAYSVMALLDLQSGDLHSARDYVHKAESVFERIPQHDNRENYYTAQVRLLRKEGKYVRAKYWLDTFLAYANERNSISTRVKVYRELRALYAETANWKAASELADSIEQMQRQMTYGDQKQLVYDLEAKYQTDLKNAEIQRLTNEKLINRLEIEKQRRHVWMLIGGLILALMAILGSWFAFRTKQQANRELRQLNDELKRALDQNTLLVKEIHHRVKNNLQVVSSLLNLQGMFEKDEAVIHAINAGKDRVQSISLLHKTLYNNQDLKSVNVRPYFTELIEHLVNSYLGADHDLDLTMRIGNFQLDVDTLVPLGLIANELITNTFKYAFHQCDKPKLDFTLLNDGDRVTMAVKDNGPGLQINSLPRRSRSLGMQLISSFAERLEAEIKIDNTEGCHVSLQFDVAKEALQAKIA